MKEIIIFMTACKLIIGNYKGLYNANIWMSTALWGISGDVCTFPSQTVIDPEEKSMGPCLQSDTECN